MNIILSSSYLLFLLNKIPCSFFGFFYIKRLNLSYAFFNKYDSPHWRLSFRKAEIMCYWPGVSCHAVCLHMKFSIWGTSIHDLDSNDASCLELPFFSQNSWLALTVYMMFHTTVFASAVPEATLSCLLAQKLAFIFHNWNQMTHFTSSLRLSLTSLFSTCIIYWMPIYLRNHIL